jgi:predicted nuclease of predicted toxin-antitoxin system
VRVLLDENLPVEFATLLQGHEVQTVSGLRWQGLKNGELLERAVGRFDAFVTMDRNIKQQQVLAGRPFGVLLLRAHSNRMVHLRPLVSAVLEALNRLKAEEIVRVGA